MNFAKITKRYSFTDDLMKCARLEGRKGRKLFQKDERKLELSKMGSLDSSLLEKETLACYSTQLNKQVGRQSATTTLNKMDGS